MCEICGGSYCEVTCPSYDGTELMYGSPIGECAICGSYLYRDAAVLERDESVLCTDCAESLDLDTVLALTECEDACALLCELGFRQRFL